jgi:cobalt-zinc-cadmium efflux system outer membrane protein
MNAHHASTRLRRIIRGILVASLTTISTRATAQTASQPLTLRALFDSVRSTYPALRAADSRIRAAEGTRANARAFGNPILQYQVNQTSFPGGSPVNLDREATTTLTFPLEHLYQRGPRAARASAEVRAAAADAASTRQQVALGAADAFFRVALAQVQVATTRDVVRWLDTLAVYNRARVEEGAAAEADLIRTELERDRASADLALAEAELARARTSLSSFLANRPDAAAVGDIAIEPAPFPLPSSLPSIDTRPDVRVARERLAAATADVSSEHRMVIGELGATIGTMLTGSTRSMAAGLSVPIPAFNTNRGNIQRAAAERDAATFELATQERTARGDLEGAADAAQILTARVIALTRPGANGFLSRADEVRRIALGTYREGAIPLFQVIDATRVWADARMTSYTTLIAQQRSVLALLAAAGADVLSPSLNPIGDSPR